MAINHAPALTYFHASSVTAAPMPTPAAPVVAPTLTITTIAITPAIVVAPTVTITPTLVTPAPTISTPAALVTTRVYRPSTARKNPLHASRTRLAMLHRSDALFGISGELAPDSVILSQ